MAEAQLGVAEEQRNVAEEPRDKSEESRLADESERLNAEKARDAAEQLRRNAEHSRQTAEDTRSLGIAALRTPEQSSAALAATRIAAADTPTVSHDGLGGKADEAHAPDIEKKDAS